MAAVASEAVEEIKSTAKDNFVEAAGETKTSCFDSISRLFKRSTTNAVDTATDKVDKINVGKLVEDKLELYVKSGSNDFDEEVAGDDHVTHYIRCVLEFKGIDYELKTCKSETRPDWLVEDSDLGGKLPCLKNGNVKVVESGAIVDYLEKTYPNPGLAEGQEISILNGLYPALTKYIKTVDFNADHEKHFLEQAKKVNDHLGKEDNTYLAGPTMTMLDLAFAPKLYQMEVTLKKFHPKTSERVAKMSNLSRYMSMMATEKAFESTKPSEENVISAWTEARRNK